MARSYFVMFAASGSLSSPDVRTVWLARRTMMFELVGSLHTYVVQELWLALRV
jgi:hypothetical protein